MLTPGLLSPKACVKYAHAHSEHEREKEPAAVYQSIRGRKGIKDEFGRPWKRERRRCKMLEMLHARNGMREREYVERLKRNWRENTGTAEGESIKYG